MILLGDFNIFDTSDQTMNAILEAGFTIPEELQGRPSNAPKTRHYDQIAFIAPKLENHLKLSEAWVFDYYEYVYREEDEPLYVEDMGEAYLRKNDGTARTEQGRTSYYGTYWRTYQMSDHLPIWIKLKTDFGEEYLRRRLGWIPSQKLGRHRFPVPERGASKLAAALFTVVHRSM